MGIDTQEMWLAEIDRRTLHKPRQLDGQIVAHNDPFEYDGNKLTYKGDKSLSALAHTMLRT